jgi:predicted metal-binding protein
MTASTLYVCTTCRSSVDDANADPTRAGARLLSAVQRVAAEDYPVSRIVGVECLSNCSRGCTIAVGAPGKWTYVIGNLDAEQHGPDILAFARQHSAHETGVTVWRERPEHIRKNTIARVPPMNLRESS